MGREQRFLCKDIGKNPGCERYLAISERVLDLMLEQGESLPERCPTCQKLHRRGKQELRISYFNHELIPAGIIPAAGFHAGSATVHHDRDRRTRQIDPNMAGMKVRITDDHIRELYAMLEQHQVVVLASPTGTGKSVYVLYRLLEAPPDYEGEFIYRLIRQGQVIQTQPLSAAVERIPETVSQRELGESAVRPMGVLGLRHRGREDYDRHNLGVVVTDGSLRNWIRDGHLGRYSLIMVDEAHKRSLNIDNLLALLQYKLPLYPHLKVIIASATINIDEFKEAFASQGISTDVLDLSLTLAEQINYHVHFWQGGSVENCDCWLCSDPERRRKFWQYQKFPPEEGQLPEVISNFVLNILRHTREGSILAFFPGEAVIERTRELIEEKLKHLPFEAKVPVLTVYSRLGEAEVSRRFNYNPQQRRVLLTTDIAETSHTMDDLVHLIESGYIKQTQWDPADLTSTLPTIRHSQAGCRQRFGRVGRTQKGYVYCLYGENEFGEEFKEQTTPEVFRSSIDETQLTLKAAGIGKKTEFIGQADDQSKFETELIRSQTAISTGGFIDQFGDVTEEGLEIFRIPLSFQKKALLDLADEQNCFSEMLIFLSLLESDRNEARCGAELYNSMNGLFVWDPRWTAATKLQVWRIHRAFKSGLLDDLDLLLKLAVCYCQAEQNSRTKEWAAEYFLNYDLLEKVMTEQRELREIFMIRAETRELRPLDISRISKLRVILSQALSSREVTLAEEDGQLIYTAGEGQVCGLVSDLCAGNWQAGNKALLVSATKKIGVMAGVRKPLSYACCLVSLDSNVSFSSDFFLDQKLPVGTRVLMNRADNGGSYIGEVLAAPPQINVAYGKTLDFEMLMDNYLRPGYQPRVSFSDDRVKSNFAAIESPISAVWLSGKKARMAKLVGWELISGHFHAVVTPFDERKEIGWTKDRGHDQVEILRVFKGPEDEKGWVLGWTSAGLEIAIETNDLTVAYAGYGLRVLEGQILDLTVKGGEMSDSLTFSYVEAVIKDLAEIVAEVKAEREYFLDAYVEKIDFDRGLVVVYTLRPNNIIHFFQLRQRTINPGWRIGQRLPIVLRAKSDLGYRYRDLEDYERETLPSGWEYDADAGRVFFPYCLSDQDMRKWEVTKEEKEAFCKSSWNFCLEARYDFGYIIRKISRGEQVSGVVVKITRYQDTQKISGVIMEGETADGYFTGFVPARELEQTEDGDLIVPEIGEKITGQVIDIRPERQSVVVSLTQELE